MTTYYDNPSGATVSAARRAALVEIARRGRVTATNLPDRGRRLPGAALLRRRRAQPPVVRSPRRHGVLRGDISKSFSPGIRVGWGILPRALLGPVLAAKGNLDFGSPHFNQVLMATVCNRACSTAHLGRLRDHYRGKLDAMLAAADEFLGPIGASTGFARPAGCTSGFVFPNRWTPGWPGPLFDRAVRAGVLYVPGELLFSRRSGLVAPKHGAAELRHPVVRRRFAAAWRRWPGPSARSVMTIIDRYLLRQFLQSFLICYSA